MKKATLAASLMVIAIAVGLMGSPVMAAEVSQGKCIQYDEATHKLTIEAYDTQFSKEFPYGQSTGATEIFDVSTAAIGIHPEPGDILRLAWVEKDSVRSGLKVMNVSKQDLRKK
ncbi:conserved exported hypothetical protein [Desulfosarcina cetonica]|uniref:hypothetical protein n=1 Tax=Desulfosarcina cetonica TaxID=90730 RepID=UPI0006CF7F3E|nr:hypothetical protein [Desulfosarcina cetonica]VTR64582.1 conserved exported hypothetical protein [Desulfosarcina cetonica]